MNEVIIANEGRNAGIEELLRMLQIANMLHERQQIDLLMNYMAESEKNYAAIMQELNEIKSQMKELLDRPVNEPAASENKKVFSGLVEQAGNTVEVQKQKLENIRQDLNTKAEQIIQNFKNMGTKALNNVCSFLGIQEKLIEMRDHARSAEMDMKNAVEKLDGIENELSTAAAHVRTAGRIVSNKEQSLSGDPGKEAMENKGSVLFRMLRNHYQKRQNTYTKRAERLNGAIEDFCALEQKASVIKKLSENREKIAVNDKGDRDESRISLTEHKKDEIER